MLQAATRDVHCSLSTWYASCPPAILRFSAVILAIGVKKLKVNQLHKMNCLRQSNQANFLLMTGYECKDIEPEEEAVPKQDAGIKTD